ncbi:IS5 family transposase [Streptomyces sp. NRRL WC-3723]|uniref:IS5 family transposase n=1 Tax=Streptomyces sp. NRRL WC-3723 TaxID=1519491 RepID=UPI000A880AD9
MAGGGPTIVALLSAIAWKYRTNSPWRDLPAALGPFQTAHKRLIRWAVDGTWEMILAAVLSAADADDAIDWAVSVGSAVIRAHQHAAGARKRGRPAPVNQPTSRPRSRTLSRRLSTKVHLAADGGARPLAFTITAGQAGDAPAFETAMSRIRVPRIGPGRPRTRPLAVLADRAYSSRAIRSHLRHRGIRAVIPQPSDQIGHRLRRGRQGNAPRPGRAVHIDRAPPRARGHALRTGSDRRARPCGQRLFTRGEPGSWSGPLSEQDVSTTLRTPTAPPSDDRRDRDS